MKIVLASILLIGLYSSLRSQTKYTIYDRELNIIEGANTMADLEALEGKRVLARMYVLKKEKVIEYYTVAEGYFVGFTADINKINFKKIPYFKSQKGLKAYLKTYPPKEALERYFEDQEMQ
jgi:hypothetical protein